MICIAEFANEFVGVGVGLLLFANPITSMVHLFVYWG